MTVVKGHTLVSEGAAFSESGSRVRWNSTGGTGSALCSCGERSPIYGSGSKRKEWHREHKIAMRK